MRQQRIIPTQSYLSRSLLRAESRVSSPRLMRMSGEAFKRKDRSSFGKNMDISIAQPVTTSTTPKVTVPTRRTARPP